MSELPEGWVLAPLGEIVDILDAKRIPINSEERGRRIKDKNESQLYRYYGATGQVGYIDDFLFDETLILLGEDGVPFFDPLKIKAYQVSGKYWVNNHAHVLRAINNLANQDYVSSFLNSFDYTGYVSGSTRLKLTQASMRSIPVALAPLNEQKRIADKLDRLLAKVDSCRERIDRIPLILKSFRRSVLDAATSGELTEYWRDSCGHNQKSEWQEYLIGELMIGKPRNGYSPKSVEFETPTKSLTLTATTSGKFKPQHFKYIDELIPQNSHLWLEPGDILIQRANTLEYVGVSAIYFGTTFTFIYPDLMMKCKANSQVTTSFLHYLLSSNEVRSYFRENATGTAGNMPKINQQTVISAPVIVPPIQEQQEIVRRVEKLFAFADRLEARYQTARAQIDKLTPALLAKAFQGELVPQDPTDETAAELLAKIQSKSAPAKATKTRKK